MKKRVVVAVACRLSLAAGGVFAQDTMNKGEMMKKGEMKKDGMKKEDLHKGEMMKKDETNK